MLDWSCWCFFWSGVLRLNQKNSVLCASIWSKLVNFWQKVETGMLVNDLWCRIFRTARSDRYDRFKPFKINNIHELILNWSCEDLAIPCPFIISMHPDGSCGPHGPDRGFLSSKLWGCSWKWAVDDWSRIWLHSCSCSWGFSFFFGFVFA